MESEAARFARPFVSLWLTFLIRESKESKLTAMMGSTIGTMPLYRLT